METLPSNLRHGLRLLHRDWTVTLVSLVALGTSIGALATVFTAVDAVLIRPLPYPQPGRIVVLRQRFEGNGAVSSTSISAPEFTDYRVQNRTFDAIAAYTPAEVNFTGSGDPQRLHAVAVTPGFFRVLGAAPVAGRTFLEEEGQPGRNNSVVLWYGLWRRQFAGERSAVGKTILLNGRARSIAGVMPAHVTFPGDPDLWLPLALTPEMLAPASRPARNYQVVARIRAGSDGGTSAGESGRDRQPLPRQEPA